MGYRLGKRSVSRLEGVHPDLVRVVKRAITYTTCDFTVLEGVRSVERQRELFEAKATKIMHSRHLTGHAVDLGAWVGRRVAWDWPLYYQIADAMKKASTKEDIPIRWGGDWDSDGDYEDETWRDGPHFELPRIFYPS
ncbi:MAG: M15 family metallopeptidase [Gammaproteobacteria bacterium]|nr:M15 family metallopeptidase [Gammaproteobacteria bacterium]